MRLTPNYRSRLKRRVPPSWGSRLLPLLAFTQSVARQLHPYLKKVKEQIDSPWAISVITHILLLMALATTFLPERKPLEKFNIRSLFSTEQLLDYVPDRDASFSPVIEPDQASIGTLSLQDPAMDDPGPSVTEQMNIVAESNTGLSVLNSGNLGLELVTGFSGRTGKRKSELLVESGATIETEDAVSNGLNWIARHQFPEGRWSLHEFLPKRRTKERLRNCARNCIGTGTMHSDTAATGIALLALLGAGYTNSLERDRARALPAAKLRSESVKSGLDWLVKHQKKDGNLFSGGDGQAHMYSHGIATIALCEAYSLTCDTTLRKPAEKAVKYIKEAQNTDGGWRYAPRSGTSDTSVVGWQVMALQSARMAGLSVDQQVFSRVSQFLDSVSDGEGKFGYIVDSDKTTTMTAEGLLCNIYMGWERTHPPLIKGVDYLLDNLPAWSSRNLYYWYYGTQVLHHMGGTKWRTWHRTTGTLLSDKQRQETGHAFGSWNPSGASYGGSAGRLYVTAISGMILETYYRHLPLYQELGADLTR